MKILMPVLFVVLSFTACSQKPGVSEAKETSDNVANTNTAIIKNQPSSVKLNDLFTKADAESILGEPAYVTDSTMGSQQAITAYKSSYTANVGNGAVYFLAEEFTRIPDATTKYSFIKASNENSAGFKVLEGLGDEAYFHSDNENFYFIMARKGTRVVSLKVNKITPKTSLDNFNQVAREVIAKM